MTRVRTTGISALFFGIICLLAACSSSSNNDSSPSLPGGQLQCAPDTEITLVQEDGSPANQTVCGIKTMDSTGGDVYKFLGIPYAASTEGNNRWNDPQPPQWTSMEATEYGCRCPQGPGGDKMATDISEDCLFLNVWTTRLTPDGTGDLPVMVFIHGGAFLEGAGGSNSGDAPGHLNLYEGIPFLETSREGGESIVFVTLNYRLGALGFLANTELGIDGNFGIKDQQKALKWVQRNIALFGGDPSRVMIFGESAGAQSTALHLTIPSSQPLFKRAIMESNYAITYMGMEDASKKSNAFIKREGCHGAEDKLACMRGKSVSDILDSQLKDISVVDIVCAGLQAIIPWNPVIDGAFIFQNPINAPVAKPIMIGSNLTESIPFVGWIPENDTGLAYKDLLDFLFDKVTANNIRDTYDTQYASATDLEKLEYVITDYLWTCFNRKFATKPKENAFRYHFSHHGSFPFWVDKNGDVTGAVCEGCNDDTAVCHASELPFVFGNASNDGQFEKTFTTDEALMSETLRKYWVQFARGGDPNGADRPQWPVDTSGNMLQIGSLSGSEITVITDESIAADANCEELWDPIGYEVRSAYLCQVP
jgi:para-nitrobenzyl esterase